MNRREFIKIVAAGTAATFFDPTDIFIKRAMAAPQYFGLHPFIESHPEAVFIKRTGVAAKMDSEAKKQEGVNLAGAIFTLKDTPGIPLSDRIAIKPNLTCASNRSNTEEGMGIITDPYFVEGMIEQIEKMSFPGENIYIREGNWLGDSYCPGEISSSPYIGIAERTGVHVTDFPTGRKINQLSRDTMKEGSEVTWVDCPDGVVFKRIGYVAPFNQPDAWILNIAKFKTHGMGMTLCAKNWQGACIHPYIHFCEGVSATKNYPNNILKDFQPDFAEHVDTLFKKHLAQGVPRWDRPGMDWNSGYGMEMWAHRTCDSHSVTNTGFSIIEGIYGRNGNAFFDGPGPGNKAQDFMTNVLIFGKNPFKVDIIGNWLGGHEPGNFGLFHVAKDRGLTNTINPMSIPVYFWENGAPKLTQLESLERFELKTYYLQRNYGGQNEPLYHLVNEPFEYGSANAVEPSDEKGIKSKKSEKPEARVLGQNFPNPFNGSTMIEYQLTEDGHVTLGVYDSSGQLVNLLVNGWQKKGAHVASWDAGERVSGIYFYVFKTGGIQKIGKMILAK